MPSVVVVGGGVSGLVCAWRLRRAGVDVEVLESRSQAGGRLRSDPCGDFTIERGAAVVTPAQVNFRAVVRALGIPDPTPFRGSGAYALLRGDRIQPVSWSKAGVLAPRTRFGATASLRLTGLAVELSRRVGRLDPLRPESAAALDGGDASSYLASRVGEEVRDELVAPLLASMFPCELREVSGAFAMLALRHWLPAQSFESIDGGLGRLTRELAALVPVRLGCSVSAVETETDGARIRYRVGDRERSVVADAAVVAVPGVAVPDLCPKITPAERGFFEGVRYSKGIVAHLMLSQPPPRVTHTRIGFSRSAGLDLYGVSIDSQRRGAAPAGRGLLSATLRSEATDKLWSVSDAAVIQTVIEQLGQTPVGAVRLEDSRVVRWKRMLPLFSPGFLPRLAAFLTRTDRSPRLTFAGDYLVGPSVEASITSGMRAAAEVMPGLGTAR